ncbi:MAG: hypothetical protein QNJ54_31055 [Prochloraceae cyanobacterium]|nr:hypothetical protein [Prochloraceae cyanobacterium]
MLNIWIEWLMAFLDLSPSRVYRLLAQGKELGLIRHYKTNRKTGLTTIYLGSQYKAARNLGIEDLGAIVSTDKVFSYNELKKEVIENHTYWQQRRARRAVLSQWKGKKRTSASYYTLDKLLNKETEVIDEFRNLTVESQKRYGSRGNAKVIESRLNYKIIHITSNKVYVGKSCLVYGGSQDTIASNLGCHKITVWRHQRDLKKLQVCQHRPEFDRIQQARLYKGLGNGCPDLDFEHVKIRDAEKSNLLEPDKFELEIRILSAERGDRAYKTSGEADRFFNINGLPYTTFLAMTNVYFLSTDRTLDVGCPSTRKAYRQFVKKGLNYMPTIDKQGARRASPKKKPKRSSKDKFF